MVSLYINDSEYQQHSHAICALANQFHIKESLVRDIYEKTLEELVSKARFRKYLSILATRHVKNILVRNNQANLKADHKS